MYKCIKGFTTSRGHQYYYGNQLHYYEYNELAQHEKRHFILVTETANRDETAELEILRIRRRKEEEERQMKQRLQEEEDRRRRLYDDNDPITVYPSWDVGSGVSDTSYDPPTNDTPPDYGGGDSGGGGSTGDY